MTAGVRRRREWRERPALSWAGPLAVLAVLVAVHVGPSDPTRLSFLLLNLSDATAVIAIAAIGAGIVIVSGGFDLSVGAVLSVVNVVLATRFTADGQSPWVALAVACLLGGLCGALNAALVVVGRIPPVIATLGTSFVLGGVALAVLDAPGGEISLDYTAALTGFAFGEVPRSALLVLVAVLVWQYCRATRFGQALYAVGADPGSADYAGVRTEVVLARAYVLAGVFYGAAAAFLTAQTATGDPQVGTPLTLTVFAAVVVGAVRLGGGRGAVASVVTGALVLSITRDLLYTWGVEAYWFYVVTGVVLVTAVALTNAPWALVRSRLARSRPGAQQEVSA